MTNALKAITDFVRWGNLHAFYLIELDDPFQEYFEVIAFYRPPEGVNSSNFYMNNLDLMEYLKGSFKEKTGPVLSKVHPQGHAELLENIKSKRKAGDFESWFEGKLFHPQQRKEGG